MIDIGEIAETDTDIRYELGRYWREIYDIRYIELDTNLIDIGEIYDIRYTELDTNLINIGEIYDMRYRELDTNLIDIGDIP